MRYPSDYLTESKTGKDTRICILMPFPYGAGNRDRTGTLLPARDFKTTATGNAQYYKWLEEDADPVIKKLVKEYEQKIKKGEIVLPEYADFRLSAHSEMVALDQILKNRRALGLPVDESIISELCLKNFDLHRAYKSGEIVSKVRCVHCEHLTNGINTLNTGI